MRALSLIPLFLLLSGCAGSSPLPPMADAGLFAPGCDQFAYCRREIQPDGRDAWVLENLDLHAEGPYPAAIHLLPAKADLVILRNLTIDSTTDGIDITGNCTGCELRLEHVSLRGHGGGQGIISSHAHPDSDLRLVLRDVSIEGFEDALNLFSANNDHKDYHISLQLQNVQVRCGTRGVMARVMDLEAVGLNVVGCRADGMFAEVANDVAISRSSFNANHVGLALTVQGKATVSESTFDRNEAYGIDAQGNGVLEMTRLNVTRNGWNTTEGGGIGVWPDGYIHDSNFVYNSGYAITPGLNVPYDASRNFWGAPTGPQPCPNGHAALPGVGGECLHPSVIFAPFLTSPP